MAGFDFASNAYYIAFVTYVGGKEPNGRVFQGEPVLGRVQYSAKDTESIGDFTFDQFVPLVVAIDFLNRPSLIQDVQKIDGEFVVSMSRPMGMRSDFESLPGMDVSPQKVVYHFDMNGLLLRAENYCGSQSDMTWEYLDERLKQYGLASRVSLGTRFVIDWRFDAVSAPEDFSRDVVERLSVAAGLVEGTQPYWFGKRVDSVAPSRQASSPPEISLTPEQAAMRSATPRMDHSLRWILISGGVVAIVSGIWLKRRYG